MGTTVSNQPEKTTTSRLFLCSRFRQTLELEHGPIPNKATIQQQRSVCRLCLHLQY
jgi:hypothetical protein